MACKAELEDEREENDATADETGLSKVLYRPIPRDRRRENRDGYDCEFVDPPPEAFQSECPVCLLILKEPCLISCCGHKFCRICVERVRETEKPCPLCSEPDFSFMRERGLERFLKESQVWCSYKKSGCKWKGKLGELELHLNQNLSPENRLKGCQFVEVECTQECGEWFQRHHITSHETEQCKKRPYSCDYCQDYQSTFEDVTEIHYPQCSKYPVACPNECREDKFEGQELESHMRDLCPLTLLDCPFHYAGCQTQLPRKDMPEHMRETVTHLTLLASVTQNLVKENQRLRQTTSEQQQTIGEQQEIIAELQQKTAELQRKDQQHHDKLQAIEQGVQTQLQQKREERNSHQKMKVVDERMNKTMKEGDKQYQDKLQALEEKVQTLKEENEELQHTTADLQDKMQAIEEELQQMQQAREEKVDARTEEAHKLKLDLTQLSGFPVDFPVERTNDIVYSPAFYTHPHGYQMCVCVYPNGCGDGEGTHVSIFTYMMRGPFDNNLKWPFRGEITIQLVNQAGDHDNIEMTIHYNDETPDIYAGRVKGKERSDGGWGKRQFLAHTALPYDAVEKTQYLKDNHLIVRVVKVKLT